MSWMRGFAFWMVVAAASVEVAACKSEDKPAAPAPGTTPAVPAAPAPTPGTAPAEPVPAAPAPTAAPLYVDRPLTAADLQGRGLRELSLMRNTIFARAGNRFRKDWLRAYFEAQPWYRPLDAVDESKITDVDRANARLIAEREASFSREELEAALAKINERKQAGTVTADDDIELRLISSRLGSWQGSDSVPKSDRSPLEDPSLLDQLLSVAQLENLSRRDLRILRNTIYARRGREFKSEVLRDYFGSAAWYQIDPDYTDAKLTSIDQKNIRLIRSVEDTLGGPLGEHEHKVEDGWFAVS